MAKKQRYETWWRNKYLTVDAKSIGKMAANLDRAAKSLREMEAAGVKLDRDSGVEDDYATLYTTDAAVAKRFGMQEADEYDEDGELVGGEQDEA